MNKQTLENLFIFAITYSNTANGNKGQVYPDYINEKSRKYLGFNITDYSDVTIEDFCNIIAEPEPHEKESFFKQGWTNIYKPAQPHEILERIKDKIPLEIISSDSNVERIGPDSIGYTEIRVRGLDAFNTSDFKKNFDSLSEEYIIRTLRDIKSQMILKE
jgi:hypothetical protein